MPDFSLRGNLISSGVPARRAKFLLWQERSSRRFAWMRIDVVERLPEQGAAAGEVAEDTSVKLALQNFQSAMQGDDSLFVSKHKGNWREGRAGDGRGICRGNFSLFFKEEEFGRNRGLYFQLIQKLIELLKSAGSQEVLMARLCLISAGKNESSPGVFSLGIELEAVGDNGDQAALRWGLGLAHLQQALLFTSRHLRLLISRKKE